MTYEDVNTHQLELYPGELFTLITAIISLVLTFLACLSMAAPKGQFFQKLMPTIKIVRFLVIGHTEGDPGLLTVINKTYAPCIPPPRPPVYVS